MWVKEGHSRGMWGGGTNSNKGKCSMRQKGMMMAMRRGKGEAIEEEGNGAQKGREGREEIRFHFPRSPHGPPICLNNIIYSKIEHLMPVICEIFP